MELTDKQICANIYKNWSAEKKELMDNLKKIKGKFLTYNNDIRIINEDGDEIKDHKLNIVFKKRCPRYNKIKELLNKIKWNYMFNEDLIHHMGKNQSFYHIIVDFDNNKDVFTYLVFGPMDVHLYNQHHSIFNYD